MNEDDIRNRITDLRLKKNVSEYQMSLDLGQSKGYIQSIVSGQFMPSMNQFLNICDYFKLTPLEFFDIEITAPVKIKALVLEIAKLSEDDIEIILALVKRLSSK